MEEILNQFSGKLYEKKDILKWNLPKQIQEQIQLEQFDHFFLASSKEERHGGFRHVHLAIYSIMYSEVYLIVVETNKIEPKKINQILSILNQKNYDIIVSNGFCKKKDVCYFGVYFSSQVKPNLNELTEKINKLENINAVHIIEYTCEGCKIE